MRYSDMYVGQVLDVHFPHAADADHEADSPLNRDPTKHFYFRVVRLFSLAVDVVDLDTGEKHCFGFGDEDHSNWDDEDHSNWVPVVPNKEEPQMKITVNKPQPAPAVQTVSITLEDFPLECVQFLKMWLNVPGQADGYIFSRLRKALNNTDL